MKASWHSFQYSAMVSWPWLKTKVVQSQDEACYLLGKVEGILRRALHPPDGGVATTDAYAFLVPLMRTLLAKVHRLLYMELHLPQLPDTSGGPTFFEDFQAKCFSTNRKQATGLFPCECSRLSWLMGCLCRKCFSTNRKQATGLFSRRASGRRAREPTEPLPGRAGRKLAGDSPEARLEGRMTQSPSAGVATSGLMQSPSPLAPPSWSEGGARASCSRRGKRTCIPPTQLIMSCWHGDSAPDTALTCAGCSASWNTSTPPSWPCSEVGLPHSLSCVPAEISLVTEPPAPPPPSRPPQAPPAADDRMPPKEARVEGAAAEARKGGSGICEGGGVVVRCPAEPMQQDVKG
ncbi:hypothetical protein CRUP_002256 [Coryphaenoides rupestris]|nr:hypothetical protein CRUP_002256 [Coryphaenoides rupestris]